MLIILKVSNNYVHYAIGLYQIVNNFKLCLLSANPVVGKIFNQFGHDSNAL